MLELLRCCAPLLSLSALVQELRRSLEGPQAAAGATKFSSRLLIAKAPFSTTLALFCFCLDWQTPRALHSVLPVRGLEYFEKHTPFL